jgi:solute carrier family 10 (sodium/bile acid cotransporter), member 7
VQHFWPKATSTICTKYKISKLGSVALLIIIWQTYDQAFSSDALRTMKTSNVIFLVFMSLGLFTLFLLLSLFTSKILFSKPDTVAICYCVPAKTPAMGVPMSTVLFVGLSPLLEAKIQLPLVIYQGLQIMAGTALTGPFKRWVDAGTEE